MTGKKAKPAKKAAAPRAKKAARAKKSAPARSRYVLRLYVTGMSAHSLAAVKNVTRLCGEYLKENCDLEVIDIYKNPIYARNGQIIAAPTLVKELPLPLRRFIGDMSDTGKLVVGLDLKSKKK